MLKNPLVSVIVPAYNHQNYIVECIESIYRQSYARIELVLVDDASSDQTFEIASSLLKTPFGQRFENVLIIKNEKNIGAHSSINKGINNATGDVFSIINSDDIYQSNRIEEMLSRMSSESEFAFSTVSIMSKSDTATSLVCPSAGTYNLHLLKLRQKLNIARDKNIGFALLRQNVAISTGNFLFSRSLWEKTGPFIDLKYCHDWDFALRALLYTTPVFVENTAYLYRLHADNSFLSLTRQADFETEVVIRNFFAAIISSSTLASTTPAPINFPSYFETFLVDCGYGDWWEKENFGRPRSWRTYRAVTEPFHDRTNYTRLLNRLRFLSSKPS